MTTAYADDRGGFFQLPRSHAHIIKPSMKSWTEQGDTVFAVNAVGESIIFQLTDTEGLPQSTPDLLGEMEDRDYQTAMEHAIVHLLEKIGGSLELSSQDLKYSEGKSFSISTSSEGYLRLTLE